MTEGKKAGRRQRAEDRRQMTESELRIADCGFEKAQVILRNTPPTT